MDNIPNWVKHNIFQYSNLRLSTEGKSRLYLKQQEEQLLTELQMITNKDLVDKIKNEFISKYHDYEFEYYLQILERCKKLMLKGYNNFDEIKKIIYKHYDLCPTDRKEK